MTTIEYKKAELRGGLTLPYTEAGYEGGTPVVFVHSLAGTHASFETALRRLPAALHGYAYTQRGHGDADRPESGYEPADYAADLVDFLDAAGIGRAVLVGAGTGGVTARIVAGSHPDRAAGLVLAGVPATLDGKPGGPGEFRDTASGEALEASEEVRKETLRGLRDTDLRATLAGILVPTLILWGDQDELVPRADQETIAEAVHGARLTVYEGIGHAVHREAPDRFVADVASFATA